MPGFSRTANPIPVELRTWNPQRVLSRIVPDKKAKGGIYGSQFFAALINGYKTNGSGPICSETASYPNSIAVDGKGNLIDPDGGSRTIIVYKGPGMCGPSVGSTSDNYGQPSDATSPNAATGTIVVGNIFDTSGAGSISLCTLSGGCTTNLTNANMYEVAGVAQAKNGDCWASATSSGGTATLTYFAGCTGAGQAATGFVNAYYGGLDIDKAGNLVSIDAFTPALRVYKGCNPTCTLVGGPFALNGDSVYGHLNKKSTEFVAGDYANGELDVYKYKPTGLTYQFSITSGFNASDDVEGAAFNPRSKE
ncbi:MAG TPA: hypothetical protein VMU38_01095 [Candidatus Binatia bacterium]|nr:hypothetical protein [Candidatus Binatia bacterium]